LGLHSNHHPSEKSEQNLIDKEIEITQ